MSGDFYDRTALEQVGGDEHLREQMQLDLQAEQHRYFKQRNQDRIFEDEGNDDPVNRIIALGFLGLLLACGLGYTLFH